MINLSGILNIATGLLGIGDAARKNARANRAGDGAFRIAGKGESIFNRAFDRAMSYDPRRATDQAVAYGAQQRGKATRDALTGLNTDFKNYGGAPGGDTAFNLKVGDTVRGIMDPLAAFAAEQRAGETERAISILQAAMAMGGNVFSNYNALQQGNRADPSGAMGLFAKGLDSMVNKKGKGNGSASTSSDGTGQGRVTKT